MMDTQFRITLEGHEVAVSFKRLTMNARAFMDNHVGPAVAAAQRQPGQAEMAALIGCIDKLYIDGEEIPVAAVGNKADLVDEETGRDLLEILLGEILKMPKNRRVLLRRYREVFEEYVPEDAQPLADLNPTG